MQMFEVLRNQRPSFESASTCHWTPILGPGSTFPDHMATSTYLYTSDRTGEQCSILVEKEHPDYYPLAMTTSFPLQPGGDWIGSPWHKRNKQL